MQIEIVRRVALARHLFELAEGSLRSKNDLHLFSAINLAQDAVEIFLVALADHLLISFDQNTKFDKYFTLIDERIAPKQLPFKPAMIRLNRLRIDSKHHGLQPARGECERLLASAREFLNEASMVNLGSSFSTISAIDLLSDGDCKTYLLEAKRALETGRHEDCLVLCRKALYVEIEIKYDISKFKDGDPGGLILALTSAPYYARSKEYIAKNVRDPTDFIVLDHAAVDRDLLTSGVDPTEFWNVWRLTPEVYRNETGKWYIKHDFSKLDDSEIDDIAEYVFNSTVDIALCQETNRIATRWRRSGRFFVKVAREGTQVFEKADRNSSVIAILPADLLNLDTDYKVEGLNDDGIYWHISHLGKGEFYFGYVHDDDIEIENG